MEKVLLAIDGIKPSQTILQYALQLCQRLKAGLNVLQIIRPRQCGEYARKLRRNAHRAKQYIEDSMLAVTFAEAGEQEVASAVMDEARKNLQGLECESEKAGVPFQLTMKVGRADREIIHYVKDHRDVVITIYDALPEEGEARGFAAQRETVARKIGQNLDTPLVVVRD